MEYQVGDTVRIIDDPSQAKRLPRSALRGGCTDSNTFPYGDVLPAPLSRLDKTNLSHYLSLSGDNAVGTRYQ